MTVRRSILPAVALASFISLSPSIVGAQTFEGVITAKTGAKGRMETIQMKGSRVRLDTDFSAGPDGPGSIINDGEGTVTMLVPSKKMYTRPPMLQGKKSELADYSFTATGKKETVLGHACEYFAVKNDILPANVSHWCVASDLGFVGFAPGQQGANDAVLKKQFPKAFFVLKATDGKSAVGYEVVKIERKSLDASVFAPPADYREEAPQSGKTVRFEARRSARMLAGT